MRSLIKLAVAATLTTATLTSPALHAQEAAPVTANLSVGSDIPALEGITWLQGEPIEALNEKGKVYMLELWATWCGPCIQIIPHVNEWHKKYQSKGLEIIGMNVFEDKLETVKEFIKGQGDGMSYRVAFSGGSGSQFEKDWLIPAGIQSIPHAFLIKDGKIIFKGHPGGLTDETIENMLSSDFDAEQHAAELADQEKAEQELREKVTPLFQAQDWDGIIKAAAELEDGHPAKLQLLLTAVSEKADWNALKNLRAKVAADSNNPIPVAAIDENAALGMKSGDGAKEYAVIALKDLAMPEGSAEQQIPALIAQARLQFLAEDSTAAETTLTKVKELTTGEIHPQFKAQLEQILPAIEKALSENKFPSMRELAPAQ